MATLTASKVVNDVISYLRDARDIFGDIVFTNTHVAGNVPYENYYRSPNSLMGYITVKFVTGNADQIDTGVVMVNIHVPDIGASQSQRPLRPEHNPYHVDWEGVQIWERRAQEWVNSLRPTKVPYLFELQQTIFTVPDRERHEHVISVGLSYRYLSDEEEEEHN